MVGLGACSDGTQIKVVSIASDYQSIEWTVGGLNATYSVTGDAVFSGQHTATELPSGNVLLFDNGYDRTSQEEYSRALELELDPQGGVARHFWEFRPNPDNWARALRSARRLGNGNTFAAFGISSDITQGPWVRAGPIEVFEVTPGKEVAWHLSVEGETPMMYRATPLSDIAGETIVPGSANSGI